MARIQLPNSVSAAHVGLSALFGSVCKRISLLLLLFLLSPNLVSAADENIQIVEFINVDIEAVDDDLVDLIISDSFGWNEMADGINKLVSSEQYKYDTDNIPENETVYFSFRRSGTTDSYSLGNIRNIHIKDDLEFMGDLTPINELNNGISLIMDPGKYITGECSIAPDHREFGLVLNNSSSIKGLQIKDLNYSITYEGESNGEYWLYYGIICCHNMGSIEDCEVIDSKISVQGFFDSAIYTAAIATVNDDTKGTVKNCLVKDYTIENNIDCQWVYGAQIVGVNLTTGNVTNCCAFITDENSIIGNNYPLISATRKVELEDNKWTHGFDYSDIDTSNKAFVFIEVDVSGQSAEIFNIENGDERIVRYDINSGNDGTKTFSTQQGLTDAIVNFCNTDGCNFTIIGYNGNVIIDEEDYVYDENDYFRYHFSFSPNAGANNEETIGCDLPLSKNNYPLQIYDDKYVVSDTRSFVAMANILLNQEKFKDKPHHFIFASCFDNPHMLQENGSALYLTDIKVPSWCRNITLPENYIVEGYVQKEIFWEMNLPSPLYLYHDVDHDVAPIFQKIGNNALVKNIYINVKAIHSENGGMQAFTIRTNNFGFLAAENNGTIENCQIVPFINSEEDSDGKLIITNANTADGANIGCLVGVNNGTISNVINNIFTTPFTCTSRSQVNFGGLVGNNKGIVRDVIQYGSEMQLSSVNEGSQQQSSEINYGLFVAKNDESATLKNVFWLNMMSEGAKINVDIIDCINKGESQFIKENLINGLSWIAGFSDLDDIRLFYLPLDKSDVLDVNPNYMTSSPELVKHFSEPAKWCNVSLEGDGYDFSMPFLTFSDLHVDFNEDKSVAIINISDEKDAAQLSDMLNMLNSVYGNATINLNADIELGNHPMVRQRLNSLTLGTKDAPFKGTFNGNGFSMSNLNLQVSADNIEEVEDANGQKVSTFTDSGIFGVLDKGAEVKDVQFKDAVVHFYNNNPEAVKDKKELSIGLLAGTVRGKIKGVSISAVFIVDDSQLEDGTAINVYIAGNNDSGASTAEEQSEISNVAVFIPNMDLLYKGATELESWYWTNGGVITDSLTFENAYSYWANATQYFKNNTEYIKSIVAEANGKQITDADVVYPTFESFAKWYNALEQDSLPTVTARIREHNFDNMSDLIHVARNLLGWYHKEAQKDLRTADQKAWADYANTPSEGNHVAVVATQNLCKSPGKGRTHKVCSAPSGGSSNKVLLLNPYAKDVPETEMECTLDEFASGYAAHWLNYDEKGYSGSYNKMWSQGLLHPIMATDKNKYVVKLEYINEDAEDLGLEYTTYGKVGQTLDLFYTQKPTNVFLDDVELDNTTFAADHLSFVVPETADGKGVVSVHVYFKGTPITDIDADGGISVSALQNRVIISGAERQQITVSNLQGVAVSSQQAQSDNVEISLPKGVYIVKAGNVTKKVLVE